MKSYRVDGDELVEETEAERFARLPRVELEPSLPRFPVPAVELELVDELQERA